MDIAFDTLGGEMQARSWGMLKSGGILVSTVEAPDPSQAEAHSVRAVMFSAVPDGTQLGRIAEMADAGQIRPNVGAVLPLTVAAEAQEMDGTGEGEVCADGCMMWRPGSIGPLIVVDLR